MPRSAANSTVLLLAGAGLLACAHAPPSASPGPSWPPGSPHPRVRWATSLPSASGPAHSWWARAGATILGVEAPREPSQALRRPYAVAILGQGVVAVADPDAAAVFRLSPGGQPSPIECQGIPWGAPMGLAAAGTTLYVADAALGAVVRIEPSGRCTALGEGALVRPVGVALSGPRILVVDTAAHAVVVLGADGREIHRFGTGGEEEERLHFPVGIAVGPDATVLVVDSLHFRVARYGPEGRFLASVGAPVDGEPALQRPKGVGLDGIGRIYVSDAERDRILVFRPDGALDLSFGTAGDGPSDLSMPSGLAVAGQLLYVADSLHQRVQVFELLGESP